MSLFELSIDSLDRACRQRLESLDPVPATDTEVKELLLQAPALVLNALRALKGEQGRQIQHLLNTWELGHTRQVAGLFVACAQRLPTGDCMTRPQQMRVMAAVSPATFGLPADVEQLLDNFPSTRQRQAPRR